MNTLKKFLPSQLFIAMSVAMIFAFSISFSCASSKPAPAAENSGALSLDQAIHAAAGQIDARVEAGSKIALVNFSSPSDAFSTYVLDELSANLVESGRLMIIDRKEIDLLRDEMAFQVSGEVDDNSIQELGRVLGAQSIVTGSHTSLGGLHRIVIRALNVQTAAVVVQYRGNIVNDDIVTVLLSGGRSAAASARATTTSSPTAASSTETIVVATEASSSPQASSSTSSTISTQAAQSARPAGPRNGTYTFYPRLRALQRGMPANVYIHKIVVHGGYMNIFFADKAVGVGASGVPYFRGSHIQDLDDQRRVYPLSNEAWQENQNYWAATFEGVLSTRFTLINTNEHLVFEEIILGDPDE